MPVCDQIVGVALVALVWVNSQGALFLVDLVQVLQVSVGTVKTRGVGAWGALWWLGVALTSVGYFED